MERTESGSALLRPIFKVGARRLILMPIVRFVRYNVSVVASDFDRDSSGIGYVRHTGEAE